MTPTSAERIALIHSNADLSRVLKAQLERTHVSTEVLTPSGDAIAMCLEHPPAAVVCEVDPSNPAEGLSLIRELREKTGAAGFPILALVGDSAPEARLEALSAGASDYVMKPFAVGELVRRINNMIRESTTELSGRLENFKMPDVLQLLETNLATGVLRIEGDAVGEIHLFEGQICAALSEALSGEPAAYRIIPTRRGRFHFRRTDIRHNLKSMRSTTELMMEALRRADERAKAV